MTYYVTFINDNGSEELFLCWNENLYYDKIDEIIEDGLEILEERVDCG